MRSNCSAASNLPEGNGIQHGVYGRCDTKLQQHIHLHCIVTGGALSEDGQRFRRSRQGFLFDVEELSAAYRNRYCAKLRQWSERLAAEEAGWSLRVAQLADELSEVEWVVYAKRPMTGPEQVIEYLSRYTQRVAISNARLVGLEDGVVIFRWKNYNADGAIKIARLPVSEFIRRFPQHVLPAGYVRIRHYGLLASRERERKLNHCRELLGAPARQPEPRKRVSYSWVSVLCAAG
ncbi:MAG: IS91 family transposase [Blastocatellia bacterium]